MVIEHSSYNWRKGPWQHIRGDVGRAVAGWSSHPDASPDCVEAELSSLLQPVVVKHLKMRAPTRNVLALGTPLCQRAYKNKLRTFEHRKCNLSSFKNAIKRCKRVQRRAFKEYNSKLSSRLGSMSKSDKKLLEPHQGDCWFANQPW